MYGITYLLIVCKLCLKYVQEQNRQISCEGGVSLRVVRGWTIDKQMASCPLPSKAIAGWQSC